MLRTVVILWMTWCVVNADIKQTSPHSFQMKYGNEHQNSKDVNLKNSSVLTNLKINIDTIIKDNQQKYSTVDEGDQLIRRVIAKYLGYLPVDGWMGHYKIHSDKKNWYDAMDVCAEEGAHLLIINSQQEANGVRSLVRKSDHWTEFHWIGFHDHYEDGKYVTIKNETLESTGFTKWGIREPDERPGENCGVFGSFDHNSFTNYSLGDWWCSELLPFICEDDSHTNKPQNNERKLPGYVLDDRMGYYKLHNQSKTWFEAQKMCENEGTHLVIINSDQEGKLVGSILSRIPDTPRWCWVGVHYSDNEKKYLTLFNETLESTGFNEWRDNSHLRTVQNCVGYHGDRWKRGYQDRECSVNGYFICEEEI